MKAISSLGVRSLWQDPCIQNDALVVVVVMQFKNFGLKMAKIENCQNKVAKTFQPVFLKKFLTIMNLILAKKFGKLVADFATKVKIS